MLAQTEVSCEPMHIISHQMHNIHNVHWIHMLQRELEVCRFGLKQGNFWFVATDWSP